MNRAFDEAVAELAHPFGSHAFVAPLKRRGELPQREQVAYEDEDFMADGTTEPHEEGEIAPKIEAGASSAAPQSEELKNGKRKRPYIVKSVLLPNWMDLDQEQLPNGGPVCALIDTAVKKTTTAVLPAKLDKLGGVGELAIQMRTSRTDEPYEKLLASYTEAAARMQQAAQRPATTPGEGYVCRRCEVPGHWLHDCPMKDVERVRPAVPPPDSHYVCKLCSVPGHWIDKCPQKRQPGGSSAHDGDADGDGDRAGNSVGGARGGAAHVARSPAAAAEAAAAAEVEGGTPRNGGDDASAGRPSKRHSHRPPKGYVCDACHAVNDHFLTNCPRYAQYKQGPPPADYVCKRCNQAGHWLENCTASMNWKAHSAADGRSAVDETILVEEEACEVGEDLAESLQEEKPEVISTIQRVVQLLGEEVARQLLVQTWQVEDSGGLLTLDGSNRRRTPGGVFLWLVKQRVTDAQRAQLFPARGKADGQKAVQGD